jgi:integrase
MPLELRTQRDGSYRDTWYGRYEINGKLQYVNLGIKIAGVPPDSRSLRDVGDQIFERSRATAQAKLDGIIEEARSKTNTIRLVEKLYEIKTGEQIKCVTLDGLADEWGRIPRKRQPNERYAAQCKSTINRFVLFIKSQHPKAKEIAHITRTMGRAFMEAETNRGVTAKTWNDTLKLLRATFKHLLPNGSINPFSKLPTLDTETVFRVPFTPEELKAIVEVARDDDFIRPIIVTGMCTAMRRGDCCLLKWEDVDLERQFITVKTAKTGQTVSIPIFPMLFKELVRCVSDGNQYVFPAQAAMYLENADGITWRVKKVLAAALREPSKEIETLPEVSDEEARRRGQTYIAGIPNIEKRERMRIIFDLYMDRKPTKEILAGCDVSKGSVSGYLNEIEIAIGCRIVRGRSEGISVTAMVKNDKQLLTSKREGGSRRASIRDFHSFRVTWVTLALTAGVPLELVQKVTGHKTTDIVLKHYFQPGREEFRRALSSAMPTLLTTGRKTPREELQDLLADTANWEKNKARIMELGAKI